MPTFLPGSAQPNWLESLPGLRAIEEETGRELILRLRDDPRAGQALDLWCWNEEVSVPCSEGDPSPVNDLVDRALAAARSKDMRDALDVLELVERHRRFTPAGWAQDDLHFCYRLSVREARTRLEFAGRRGILFLNDETEELGILLRLEQGYALLHESKTHFDDFESRQVEPFEVQWIDATGAAGDWTTFEVQVAPALGNLEVGLHELFRLDAPFVLARNPESGLPFLAHRSGPEAIDVYEYVVFGEQVVSENVRGFPPVGAGEDSPTWHDLLMCPACRADLDWNDTQLACTCGEKYSVIDGRPDFLAGAGEPPTAHPGEVWSPNPKQKALLYFLKKYPRGVVLDCGSGNATFSAPNLVNLEVFPFESVNVVADGQRLPFRDNSLDAIISAAVLEHVPNPFSYCSELRRVLKPGGEVRIDSAFLQPYHACPDHYFGATKSGILEATSGFESVGAGVAPGQTPFVALQTWLYKYSELLADEAQRERFLGLTVGQVLDFPNGVAPRGLEVPAASAALMASGVYMHGVKKD